MPGGPPMSRPILPRDRGVMDKLVEFIVGDGPANRFALICRQCSSHNGMALQEEFEYLGKYFVISLENFFINYFEVVVQLLTVN